MKLKWRLATKCRTVNLDLKAEIPTYCHNFELMKGKSIKNR